MNTFFACFGFLLHNKNYTVNEYQITLSMEVSGDEEFVIEEAYPATVPESTK